MIWSSAAAPDAPAHVGAFVAVAPFLLAAVALAYRFARGERSPRPKAAPPERTLPAADLLPRAALALASVVATALLSIWAVSADATGLGGAVGAAVFATFLLLGYYHLRRTPGVPPDA